VVRPVNRWINFPAVGGEDMHEEMIVMGRASLEGSWRFIIKVAGRRHSGNTMRIWTSGPGARL
jgi:hypothetical protein